jgi:SAM-dependent methyltransferase
MFTNTTQIDEARLGAFMEKALGDASSTMAVTLAALGDRLGLFAALADGGPATSAELAERAGVNERYAREWLRGLTAAGYLDHERDSGRFSLSPEHALVLAAEGAPVFLGGAYELTLGYLHTIDRLTEAFRSGGGVPQSAYPAQTWEGMCRFSQGMYDNQLVQQWVPSVPGLAEKLAAGSSYADVGCGAGRALLRLAEAFPASKFAGYDAFPAQIERARAAARDAGLEDRVRFEVLDAAVGLPERYDVISTFDVVHDSVDPASLLGAIRRGLNDGGTYLILEMRSHDDPADNVGPLATLLYGVSVLYCMTTSLAGGGEGLGTCGLPPAKLRELCAAAGFASMQEIPLEDPFNALYAARA